MLSTSRPPFAKTGDSATVRGERPNLVWLWHTIFAVAYIAAVVVSMSVVYPGTFIAIAWPPVGIAVWWAITCRSRWAFVLMSVFVFAVPALHLGVFVGRPFMAVVFAGLSHVIAGPAIAPVIALIERVYPIDTRSIGVRRPALFARIAGPRDIYRLLIASLIMIPIAKGLSLLAIAIDGGTMSITLYMGLVFRDLSAVIAVAGPGIAIFSSAGRGIGAAAIREFIGVVAVTAVLMAFIFGPGQNLPIVYFAMLPLYWSATRLPVSMAMVHAVITAGTATILGYWVGAGPFAAPDTPITQALAIQIFIITSILLSLVVSTTVQRHSLLVSELEALIETIPDALMTIDRTGRAVPVNVAAQGIVVSKPDGTFVGRRLREVGCDLLNDSTRPSGRALRGEHVRGTVIEFDDATAEENNDGPRYYSVSASPLYLPGDTEPDRALLLYHDSTDKLRAIKQLQRAHDRARDLFEHAPQGIATLDENGMILQVNNALGELVGVPVVQLLGRRLDEFSAEENLTEEINSAFEKPGTLVHTDRCLNAQDGQSRSVALSFRTMTGEDATPPLLLVHAVDITERQRLHEFVAHLADHDSLTGLFNRRRFESEFEKILEQSAHELNDGAVLLVDLDNFKMVNDLLGHHAGDELLVEFAKLLKTSIRSTDLLGRLGGDEFVIVLPDVNQVDAIAIGTKIVETVNPRFSGRPNALGRVTASIGISMFSEAREQGLNPLMLADRLLYDAKHSGRNRFAVLNPGNGAVQPAQLQMSRNCVERVLDTDAFTIELQPIAESATGRIVIAEGLLRVVSSEAPISTGEFVAAVEKAGLGRALDVRVLRKGIGLLPELQRARPGFRLALNLSAQSVGSEDVARVVVAELKKHRVPPGSLVLEVTESAPIEDVAAARRFQRTVREHGVEFAIDDFGAGFDPYRCLKQLDFDILKIAGEFIEGMAGIEDDLSIVRSLVRLAEDRGMLNIAEFVSDDRIFDLVRQLGITYMQGYYIGASLPLQDFIATHLTES